MIAAFAAELFVFALILHSHKSPSGIYFEVVLQALFLFCLRLFLPDFASMFVCFDAVCFEDWYNGCFNVMERDHKR